MTTVVTGGASGIGAATVALLRSGGEDVITVDIRDADVIADLSTAQGREAAIAGVRERVGDSLDGLVCCAGVGPSVPSRLIAMVNYYGSVDLLDGLLPLLAAAPRSDETGRPAAVVIASNSASFAAGDDDTLSDSLLAGDPDAAAAVAEGFHPAQAYGQSKRALTKAVRRRAGQWGEAGVRLNAVAPGAIETPLLEASRQDPEVGAAVDALPVPVGRHGRPEEMAAIVEILLGPKAAFVHGSVWFADGGTDALIQPDRF